MIRWYSHYYNQEKKKYNAHKYHLYLKSKKWEQENFYDNYVNQMGVENLDSLRNLTMQEFLEQNQKHFRENFLKFYHLEDVSSSNECESEEENVLFRMI